MSCPCPLFCHWLSNIASHSFHTNSCLANSLSLRIQWPKQPPLVHPSPPSIGKETKRTHIMTPFIMILGGFVGRHWFAWLGVYILFRYVDFGRCKKTSTAWNLRVGERDPEFHVFVIPPFSVGRSRSAWLEFPTPHTFAPGNTQLYKPLDSSTPGLLKSISIWFEATVGIFVLRC